MQKFPESTLVCRICFISILAMTSPPLLSAELEEVVVTARKTTESLQEIPLSVIAFSPEDLEQQNVADLADLSAKLPSVFIGAGGGLGSNNGSFFIRGLGTDRNAVNQESAVALYIDDAYYGRSDGALLSVLDVASIEVLRGPQGTLFGRNATAGTIRYITKKPDDELSGKVQITLGSDKRLDLKASVNIPLSDSAALRLSAASINQDGFQTNAVRQDLGDKGTDVVRAYLRFAPSDSFELLASFDYSKIDTNGSAYSLLEIRNNPDSAPAANGINQAIAANFDVLSDPIGSTTQSGSTLRASNKSDSFGASLTFNWYWGSNLQLKWSSTFRTIDIKSDFDFDATRAPLFENQNLDRDSDAYSSELQLSGDALNKRMRWVTGLYYYNESSNDSRDSVQAWSPRGEFNQVGGGAASTTTRTTLPHELESIALFGQISYDITNRFAITAGLRYTDDKKSIRSQEFDNAGNLIQYRGDDPAGNIGDITIRRSDSWNAISGRLSLDLQVTDSVFLFASYARGFRGGGINDRIRRDLAPPTYGITSFGEELVDTYEFGIRSDLLQNTLRVNLTYFINDFSDLQISAQQTRFDNGRTRTVVSNVGNAESSGLEAEIAWLATENVRFDVNFGLIDSKVNDGGASIDNGVRLPNTPEFQYSIGAELTVPVGAGNLIIRADYAGIDDFFSNAARGQMYQVDGYETLDANIAYEPVNPSWSIAIYGKNITDEKYFTQALSFLTDAPFGVAAGTPARGREYGVKFKYEF